MKKAADDNDDADMAAAADGSCAVNSRRRWEPIPEVAALDAKLAPYMKNPEEEALKHQYIAVRLGYAAPAMDAPGQVTAVRNAIFLSWEDAKEFVEFENHKLASVEAGGVGGKRDVMTVPFYSNVEWKAFDEFDKAEVKMATFLDHNVSDSFLFWLTSSILVYCLACMQAVLEESYGKSSEPLTSIMHI